MTPLFHSVGRAGQHGSSIKTINDASRIDLQDNTVVTDTPTSLAMLLATNIRPILKAQGLISFHKPHIRPIVRGKAERDVEFGPKCSLSYVDGYMFLDKLSFESYHEGVALDEDMRQHKKRFGITADTIIADKIYGTRSNREMLEEKGIKASLVPLGRKCEQSKAVEKWVRQKQRKRNEIEGAIGNSKTTYGLERLRYKVPGGEEINIRLGLTAMNLTAMLARI